MFWFLQVAKKEVEEGAISFSFSGRHQYEYNNLAVAVSHSRYGDPVVQVSTAKLTEDIQISSLKPGSYFWSAIVYYSSAQITGNFSFNGEIIIEKGKIMHITLED